MPPVAIGLAIAGTAAAVAGGVAANNASKRAARTAQSAADRFYDFDDPNYEQMRLKVEELKSQGLISPEEEQAMLQQATELNGVQTDPRLKTAEYDALDQLSRISSEGGMDSQAKLGMEEASIAGQGQARGARDANLLNAAQRGVSGSGLEFVSNQMADQGAANQTSMEGLHQAADANQRDLAALSGLTGLSNTMQNRDYAQQANKAQAQDAINRFNTTMQGDANQRNVSNRNNAQVANLRETQRIADQNVGLRNSANQYNSTLEHQKFQDNLARATGAGGQTPQVVGAQLAQGKAMQDMYGGLAKAGIGAGASIYGARTPEDKKDDSIWS